MQESTSTIKIDTVKDSPVTGSTGQRMARAMAGLTGGVAAPPQKMYDHETRQRLDGEAKECAAAKRARKAARGPGFSKPKTS